MNIDPEITSMPKRQTDQIETPVPKVRQKRPKNKPDSKITSPKSPTKSVTSLKTTISSNNGYHFDTSKVKWQLAL
jgi:hypothetical protein